ncbi:MAG: ERF family protein [Cyclobacteriaceae bacterium]|nr:ERF family protein [Cyclobacteriaceae bacterium]
MTHSESIANLAPALVAFGSEVTNPHNSVVNTFHKNKYAPLNEILNEVRPLLAKHGLTVSQLPASSGDNIGVTTIVLHTSGEYISDTITMAVGTEKGKSAAQIAGSIITYLRRYSLAAALNIASEDDDDGNAGLKPQAPKHEAPKPQAAPPYLQQSINDISPSKYPHALKAEVDWLSSHDHSQQAESFSEQARGLKEMNAASADYLPLLQKARDARLRVEDKQLEVF